MHIMTNIITYFFMLFNILLTAFPDFFLEKINKHKIDVIKS